MKRIKLSKLKMPGAVKAIAAVSQEEHVCEIFVNENLEKNEMVEAVSHEFKALSKAGYEVTGIVDEVGIQMCGFP